MVQQQVPDVSVVASEMATRVRELDWASTPLGPISQWPVALRIAVGICLNSRFPMFVWWGPELINIYNDGYIPMLGARHPAALGRPARASWNDIWDVVGEQARQVMERNEATWNDRVFLRMERHGYPEETYFTWSYSPILDENGRVAGLFCAVTEETQRVFAERDRARLLTQVEQERARLAEAFVQAPSFLAVLRGPEHVFEYVNRSYETLLGNRALAGRSVREAVPEVQGQGFFEILDRVYATGEAFVGRAMHVLLERGGKLEDIYIDFVYQPMRDPEGRVVGILAHGSDVTAHQLAEKRDKFLLALDEVIRGISDPLEITASAARMLGEHLGVERCLYAIVDDDEEGFSVVSDYTDGVRSSVGRYRFADYRSDLPARMRADEPYIIEDVAREQAFGDREYFLERNVGAVMAVPLHKAGRFLALVAVNSVAPRRWQATEMVLVRHVASRCWEAVQRVRAEQRVRESLHAEQAARGEAERASRMKDEFLATLSHELRTPLNAILGWAHMLRRVETASPEVQRGAEVIERNARAQSTIIADLLDMSAIISGKVRLNMEPMDLAALVRAAIDTARPAADAKGISVRAEIEDIQDPAVSGDRDRLQQVLWNLLTNAIKFTPAGGNVLVTLRRRGDHAEIRVSDTGEGIAPEFLPFMFDRFRQADASTTRRHGGLGLGLSIVKQLVEMHGGEARAHSEGVGRGATFIVTLPIAHVSALSAEEPHAPAGDNSGPVAPEQECEAIAGKHVLVVDDDADARDLVRRLLEECHASVVTAGSSAEALALVRSRRFDALVSDIGMPGEDGHSLMRRVRSLPPHENRDIPAMALTAYARPEDRLQAIRAGFQLHASKPVEPAELIALVACLVSRNVTPA
jgi:signal transduction histidine kinase/CheY-like chemotaxis protein/PAS domain-containing protein